MDSKIDPKAPAPLFDDYLRELGIEDEIDARARELLSGLRLKKLDNLEKKHACLLREHEKIKKQAAD